MKRIALFLSVCALLCLASCGVDEAGDGIETTELGVTTIAEESESETELSTAPDTEPETEPETEHVHEFSAASCFAAPTCSCGETNGYALGHYYSDGYCVRCGASDPDYVPVTPEQQYALERLNFYMEEAPYSYLYIIEYLGNNGIAYDDCVYAADNCGIDWYEQALKFADSEFTFGLSYKGLYEHLLNVKFTEEQAQYAADNCSKDWNKEAAACARMEKTFYEVGYDFGRDRVCSREYIINQLEHKGFTHEQAVYGADSLK